jgi:hypothetical protein
MRTTRCSLFAAKVLHEHHGVPQKVVRQLRGRRHARVRDNLDQLRRRQLEFLQRNADLEHARTNRRQAGTHNSHLSRRQLDPEIGARRLTEQVRKRCCRNSEWRNVVCVSFVGCRHGAFASMNSGHPHFRSFPPVRRVNRCSPLDQHRRDRCVRCHAERRSASRIGEVDIGTSAHESFNDICATCLCCDPQRRLTEPSVLLIDVGSASLEQLEQLVPATIGRQLGESISH